MRRATIAIAGLLAVCSLLAAGASAETWDEYFQRIDEDYIRDRVEVGLRISHFSFTDSKKITYDESGNIIGGYTAGISTYNMDSEPTYYPLPYVMYKFTPYIGLRLSWEQIKGRTITLDEANPHSDGDVIGNGPAFELIGRYPNETKFTPYGGVGIIFWNMHFKEDSSFYEDGKRDIDVENTTGLLLSAGCSMDISGPWSAELEVSYMMADTDASFSFMRSPDTTDWTFPMDSVYVRLGGKYRF